MKPNVDIVDLIAIQELSEPITPTKDDFLAFGKLGSLLGNKITIETVATIISELLGSAQVLPDRVYQIGVDMHGATVENGSDHGFSGSNNVLVDPYLDGKDFSIWLIGFGYLEKGDRWQNDIAGGGIRLTQTGDEFQDSAEYALVFKPQFSSVIVSPDAIGKFSDGVQVVTGNTAAGDSYNRKLISIQGATATAVTYTLNPTYPENVICAIQTGGGSNFQSLIAPPGGQTMWRNGAVSEIYLGQVDWAMFVRNGTVWRWVGGGDRWKTVGEFRYGGVPGPDKLSANRQAIAIANYPGVDAALDELEATFPGAVVSEADRNTFPTQWARSTTTIWVPEKRGDFIRGLDLGLGRDPDRVGDGLANIPGSYQEQEVISHNHSDGVNNRLLTINGTGTATTSDDGDTPNLFNSGEIQDYGGTETRPNNSAEPVYVLI